MNTKFKFRAFAMSGMMLVLLTFVNLSAFSQTTIVGKWKTIDDETGEAKSVVEIWKATDGMFYGKITKLFDPKKQESICDKCDPKDARYKKKVIGMTIINGMKKIGANEWTEGTILDPNNGKVYKCKLFMEGKNLMVRGYIAFLYRTQTWLPSE